MFCSLSPEGPMVKQPMVKQLKCLTLELKVNGSNSMRNTHLNGQKNLSVHQALNDYLIQFRLVQRSFIKVAEGEGWAPPSTVPYGNGIIDFKPLVCSLCINVSYFMIKWPAPK